MKKLNIGVIGAGIIGVNCAAELQSLGHQVTLLDRNGIGEECSKGNAGHFATEQVFPLAEFSLLPQLPKMLLDPLGPVALRPGYIPKALPWFIKFITNMFAAKRQHNKAALQAINALAIASYQERLKTANASELLILQGSLLVFENTPIEQVEAHYRHYKNAGIAVKLLNREQALALEPNLVDTIQHALYFTDVGHTSSPYQVCHAIADYCQRNGTTFKQFDVESITHTPQNVMLSNGSKEIKFDRIVIACGVWSKALLKPLGYKLPIEAERGYSLDLACDSDQPLLHRPVASAERRFIMTPMSHGLRLAGTVEFAGLEHPANMERADKLFDNAKHVVKTIPVYDKNHAKEGQRWMGSRPSLPDSLPIIGQAPHHEHIYLALGHQHLGLTLGAITGKLIGQLINESPTDIDLAPFNINRFN
ncbi:NAD(P)/FAD-dependent oxidoreductase [Thalassotalea fusca]